MIDWQDFHFAPKDRPILAWEVVIADEEDEDGNIIARGQRYERAIIVEWWEMFGVFVMQPGRTCPINGRWTHWAPITPPTDQVRIGKNSPARNPIEQQINPPSNGDEQP